MKLILLAFLLLFFYDTHAQDSIRVTLCTNDYFGCYPSYSKDIEHFDSLGRTIEIEHYYKNNCNNPPDTIMKFISSSIYTYDVNGNIIVDEIRSATSSYVKLNSFDPSGRLIATIYEYIISGVPQVEGRDSTIYDVNGNAVWFLAESYNNGNWDTTKLNTWQFDVNGRLIQYYQEEPFQIEERNYQYDTIPYQFTEYSSFISNGNLIDSLRTLKKYYSNGRLQEWWNSEWDDNAQTWNYTGRNNFEYDTIAKITYNFQFDCPDTLCEDSISKTVSTYDSLSRMIDQKYYEYDSPWTLSGHLWNHYSGNMILDDGYHYAEQGCDDAEYNNYYYNSNGDLIHSQNVEWHCNPDTTRCDYYILAGDSMLLINQAALPSCLSDTIYPVITLAGGHEPYNLQWTPSAGILDPDSISPRIVIDSAITYQLTVTDSIGTVQNISVPIHVIHSNLNLGSDTVVCQNNPLLLTAGGTYSTYHWSTGTTSGLCNVNTAVQGSQAIWLTVQYQQCFFSDTIIVTVDICSGITKINNSLISIYPNPSHGEVTIDLGQTNPLEIIIVDNQGRIIEKLDVRKKTFNFKLSSGIYFLRVVNATQILYNKIVVD